MPALTEKETDILNYIYERLADGVPPTVREICSQLGYRSTSTAHRHLASLEEKGFIQKETGRNRCIRLATSSSAVTKVPLLGTVTAGTPITATELIEEYIAVNTHYPANELFALHVKGDSMIEAGILNGDIIIAHKTPTAQNGDIVVALIDDEATVKAFYREGKRFRLQPRNSTMEPIMVDHVSILGRVVSLVRNFG